MIQLHHLSWAQRLILGDLRAGPQWEGGLKTRTFRALARRGLVVPTQRADFAYRWKLTPKGARVVLELGIVQGGGFDHCSHSAARRDEHEVADHGTG